MRDAICCGVKAILAKSQINPHLNRTLTREGANFRRHKLIIAMQTAYFTGAIIHKAQFSDKYTKHRKAGFEPAF